MTKWIFGLAVVGLAVGGAWAQQSPYPIQGGAGMPNPFAPPTYPPNYFANSFYRGTQPLSPYLNLLRGGDPGINYYYGVRPGTPTGAPLTGRFGTVAPMAVGPARTGFIPEASDPTKPPVTVSADTSIPYIPPASHAVTFGGGMGGGPGMTVPSRPGFTGSRMPPSAARRPMPGRR